MKNAGLPPMAILPDEPQHLVVGSNLTKREQFAMAAMQGLLSAAVVLPEDIAQSAFIYADDLLEELERTK